MSIITSIKKTDYGLEGCFFSTFFNDEIEFIADEEADIEYVEICASYLNALPEKVIDALFEATLRMYHNYQRTWGQQVNENESLDEIYLINSPIMLVVPEPRYGDKPAIKLSLGCEWDSEHPIEWFIRDDKVLCVCGGPLLADAWADFSNTEPWNFA